MSEIEAKFLNINVKKIRLKLKEIGAKNIHPPILYERYVYKLPDKSRGYVRIRSEGNKVTSTIKRYPEDSKYALESEININNTMEEAYEFFKTLNLPYKAYHQTIREKWSIDGCKELVIDTIPGIPTYIEIECDNEKFIENMASKLNLDMSKAEYGAYDKQYEDYYGVLKFDINNNISNLTFENIINDLGDKVIKNKKFLVKVQKHYLPKFELAKKNLATYIANEKLTTNSSKICYSIPKSISNMEYHYIKPNYSEHLSEPWFSFVALKIKTVEGRKNKGKFKDMKIGEIIEWYNDDFEPRKVLTKIVNKYEYKTFEAYLNALGLQNCLPGMPSMEHGLSVYYKYFTKQEELEYGVVAIQLEKIEN